VSNYGWKLFNFIPLVCGNATERNRFGGCAFFRNDVTLEKIQSRFMSYAAQCGKTPTDMVYHNYDTVIFELPIMGLTIPIPYVLCYNEIQLSGVLP